MERQAMNSYIIGVALFLMSTLAGGTATAWAVSKLEGPARPVVARERPSATVDRAEVADPGAATPIGEEQLEVIWTVSNTGTSTWSVDQYRFVPVGKGLPVIPLPFALIPGAHASVQAVVETRESGSTHVWNLKGPGGFVPGGRLTLAHPEGAARAGD